MVASAGFRARSRIAAREFGVRHHQLIPLVDGRQRRRIHEPLRHRIGHRPFVLGLRIAGSHPARALSGGAASDDRGEFVHGGESSFFGVSGSGARAGRDGTVIGSGVRIHAEGFLRQASSRWRRGLVHSVAAGRWWRLIRILHWVVVILLISSSTTTVKVLLTLLLLFIALIHHTDAIAGTSGATTAAAASLGSPARDLQGAGIIRAH
mmetsp:Transcript_15786/g.33998  ORF Transcript_15786/g.33998 Transcript_15786/m.33998 type:complete len:208 (-) Transcript_15786:361-984(-)